VGYAGRFLGGVSSNGAIMEASISTDEDFVEVAASMLMYLNVYGLRVIEIL
jgi:hypothetical protein